MAVHRFTPTHYHTALGAHAPVLNVAPGDTVETTTVDAGGADASGLRVTERGNPQTGPFYVEGAAPGDTLVVRLERIVPNRSGGYSASVVAPNVVDPEYVAQMPPGRVRAWAVDASAGTAALVDPPAGLEGLSLPLAPMIGCFGVAPDRGQAISTATSGPHGGNMDYRGFRAGTTVYLPVFAPGALFHIGDGHALQGDGEIVGTGIEISMDVTFSLDLVKGKRIGWPRGEDAHHVFTVGNARPLDQAVQHATTEMLRMLQAEHGLQGEAAHVLLGQCVQYDLGNVFDPAYTMVCKIAKHLLRQVARGAQR